MIGSRPLCGVETGPRLEPCSRPAVVVIVGRLAVCSSCLSQELYREACETGASIVYVGPTGEPLGTARRPCSCSPGETDVARRLREHYEGAMGRGEALYGKIPELVS